MTDQGDFKISISGKSAEEIAGKQIFPIRDPQGSITGFQDEFQQGLNPATPTALSPRQRAEQSEGFQKGFGPEEEEDFGRPDLSNVIKASATLSQQIKEQEKTLSNLNNVNVGTLAAKHKIPIDVAQKALKAERENRKAAIAELKDKKTGLEELAFGKKLTPEQDLAERRFEASQPKREIIETTPDVPGATRSFKDVPVETEKEKTAKATAKGKKTANQAKALKRISEIDAKIVSIKKGKKLTAIEGLGLLLKPELAKKFNAGEDIPIQDAIDSLLSEKDFLQGLAGPIPDKKEEKTFGAAVDANTGQTAPEGTKAALADGTKVIVKNGEWVER